MVIEDRKFSTAFAALDFKDQKEADGYTCIFLSNGVNYFVSVLKV
jgi:hypothetical protein